MSHGHSRVVCRICGDVIVQCRCPALDKRTDYALCTMCHQRERMGDWFKPQRPVPEGQALFLNPCIELGRD